jgi:hypothetical protein
MSAPKATPTPTPKAPTSGAVPAAVAKTITPIITKAPTTATSFVGPIPTGATRTATGYVTTPTATGAASTQSAAAAAAATKAAASRAAADAAIQAAKDKAAVAKTAAEKIAQDKIIQDLQDQINKLNENAAGANDASNAVAAALNAQATQAAVAAELERADAFAALKVTFDSYGLGSLSDTITRLMTSGETANGALTRLKYDKTVDPATGKAFNDAYTSRFSGNQIRIKNGLNAISEAQYIANENAYAETFKAYGLGNMLSTDRAVNEAKFATYIGNDMSSTELNDRIKTAANNVINADPVVMSTFKQYYGGLTTSDLVAYFLAPDETLPVLNNKIAAAQIGTAAQEQGLVDAYGNTNVSSTRAMQLATQMGGLGSLGNVAGAYQSVASALPAGQKLSDIYKQAGINYDQTTAENEFLTQNADAAQKRKQLASLERAQFGGDSGVNPTAGNLASARSVVGKF